MTRGSPCYSFLNHTHFKLRSQHSTTINITLFSHHIMLWYYHHVTKTLRLTLKMTTAGVVETSVYQLMTSLENLFSCFVVVVVVVVVVVGVFFGGGGWWSSCHKLAISLSNLHKNISNPSVIFLILYL